MKSNIILQSFKIQCFSENEILMNIKPDILRSILLKDEHPFFQTYVMGHEGRTRPNIIGMGGKIINWTKDAIKTIKTVIKTGIKCFKGHNKDNSTDKRKEYGEIVGYIEKEINGKLNGVIITYHNPDIREEAKDFDICSQEAVWDFTEDQNGILNADTCQEITGIAFENSKNEMPAFSNAKRLASIQCFENEDKKEEVKPMTFTELKKACEELNVFPSQLFSLDKIKQDNNFSDVFKKYETELKLKNDEVSKLKTDYEVVNKKYNDIENATQKVTAKERLEKIIKDKNKNLTENEKKFIFETLDRNADYSDDGLNKFLESRQSDYQVFSKINNIKDVVIPDKKNDNNSNEDKDYTNPLHNDLLT